MKNRDRCLVSIIIVTWNRRDDLNKTLSRLNSLLSKKTEIIVVDNGSTDRTVDLVKNYFSNINLITLSKNVGCGVGINEGFKLAKGKYLLFLDDDSYIEQKDLDIMVKRFGADPNLGIVVFNIINLKSMKSQWQNLDISLVEPKADGSYPFFTFLGCGVGIRKESFIKAGLFTEDFFVSEEEIELTARVLIKGYEVRYYPQLHVYHDISTAARGKGGILSSRIYYNVRNSLWFIWKYFPYWRALDLTFGYMLILLLQSLRAGVPNFWLKGLVDSITKKPRGRKRAVISKRIQNYYKPYFQEYSLTGRLLKEAKKIFDRGIK